VDTLWFYAIAFIVIWVLALLFKDKLNISVEGPLLMWRTTRLRDLIDSIAQKSPRFWKVYMSIGIPVAVFFAAVMIYFLILSLKLVLQTPVAAPVLPGVDYPGNLVYVPLYSGLIGLATVLIVHEFAHGILARAEGIKIKSIGLILFAVLPGAFVEPDEEEVKKASRIAKLRIYAAGSISNLTLAAIALGIYFVLSSLFIPFAFHSDGILVSSVVPKSPSDGVLKEGMIINNINGQEIRNFTEYTTFRNNSKIGDVLTIQTSEGTKIIKLASNPNNSTAPYAGFRADSHLIVNKNIHDVYGNLIPWTLYYLSDLFFWMFLLNFLVGTFNVLPIKPLDGGLIFEELLTARMSEGRVNSITSNFKRNLEQKLKLSEEKTNRISSGLRKVLSFNISETKVNKFILALSIITWSFLAFNIVYALGRGILLSF